MGVFFMENFAGDTSMSTADVAAWLTARGMIPDTGNGNVYNLGTEVENGITVPYLIDNPNYGTVGGYRFWGLRFPIPATKSFYFSARIRSAITGTPHGNLRFFMGTVANNAANQNFGYIEALGTTQWQMHAGVRSSNPTYTFPRNAWVTVEIYRAADGTSQIWLNDLLFVYDQTVSAPTDNYIFFGPGQSAAVSTAYSAPWHIADVVVVDPDTPGLQYRPGARHRVVSTPFVSDTIAQWDLPAGASGTHYPIVSKFQTTPANINILTGDTPGEREQYQSGNVPLSQPTYDKVLSVELEQRLNNTGGATHVLANEIDLGSGITEVATQTLAGASGWQYKPVFMDKKPDGSNWSLADLPNLKAGYSIKS